MLQQPFLGRNRRDTLRHADAEVDNAAKRQLHRGAPGDHLAGIKRQRLALVEGHAEFPEKA